VDIVISALDDDDVALLDLIARTGGDLSKPRPITGSAATTAEAENYSTERKQISSLFFRHQQQQID
jgi:hypothetical protein